MLFFGGPGVFLEAVWACFSDIKVAFTEQVRFMKIAVFLSKYRGVRGSGGPSGDEKRVFFGLFLPIVFSSLFLLI